MASIFLYPQRYANPFKVGSQLAHTLHIPYLGLGLIFLGDFPPTVFFKWLCNGNPAARSARSSTRLVRERSYGSLDLCMGEGGWGGTVGEKAIWPGSVGGGCPRPTPLPRGG